MATLKNSLYILIGACSYGILASIVKLGYKAGYSVHEITGSQYLFGLLLLLIVSPFFKRTKITLKQVGSLMLTGTALSLTGIFYGLSLAKNPASIAVVLLFQFTWIGILIESLYMKKKPTRDKLLSIAFLLIGTVLASNLTTEGIHSIQADGLIYGLISALCFAVFIFASGKVATEVSTIQRSLFITLGGLIIILLTFSPIFITSGILFDGLWKYALLTSLFGVIFPIVFYALGAPKLDGGLTTIIGSAELPAAVVAAVVILNERISALQVLGIVAILIGIGIPQLRSLTLLSKSKSQKLTT
jgi:drug/metabolite transporter (DMT)-like permease